jgi:hypothetical protein
MFRGMRGHEKYFDFVAFCQFIMCFVQEVDIGPLNLTGKLRIE